MEINTTTLGGNRLGSGAKSNIEMEGFYKSNFNLSRAFKSTMTSGTLIPCFVDIGLNGDEWEVDIESLIRTMPNITALFGSFKFQVDFFEIPLRLYFSSLRMNDINAGYEMDKILFPIVKLDGLNGETFDPSCLMSYLGVRGMNSSVGTNKFTMYKNAMGIIGYYDIYKNYYANKQEGTGIVISEKSDNGTGIISEISAGGATKEYDINGNPVLNTSVISKNSNVEFTITANMPYQPFFMVNTWDDYNNLTRTNQRVSYYEIFEFIDDNEAYAKTKIEILSIIYPWKNENVGLKRFNLENIDNMLKQINSRDDKSPYYLDSTKEFPFNSVCGKIKANTNSINSIPLNGLAIKTYQSDLFNNWVSTDSIIGSGGISELTKIDTDEGLLIDSFYLAKKLYDVLNRIAVSGGSYNDWQKAVYGNSGAFVSNAPNYIGGMSSEIVFEEVVSTGSFEDAPLGYVSTKGTQTGKKGGNIYFKANEPCMIMGICSITPRLDYSQGNKWFTDLKTMDDLHKPSLDGIGFQDLITEQMAHWDTLLTANGVAVQRSAGKIPAWMNYMTAVNETFGDFAKADSLMGMTLNRNYERYANTIKDLTTYIDPSKYNYVFADNSITAQNFWVQLGFDVKARRKLSSKILPFL